MSIREWSTESGPLCFVCDQPIIASRRIVWEGSLSHISESIGFGDIQLHPECADWMASAMKRDVLRPAQGTVALRGEIESETSNKAAGKR